MNNIIKTLIERTNNEVVIRLPLNVDIEGYFLIGDFELYKGLRIKKFKRVYDTNDLFLIREKLLNK
jgi:hypothetical protein